MDNHLPELRIVPTELLVLHERFDPRRIQRLDLSLLEDDVLRNPPIVVSIPNDNRFMVLDGANRCSVFKAKKIAHIVVQVVDYNDARVLLHTWNHLVTEMDSNDLDSALTTHKDFELIEFNNQASVEIVMDMPIVLCQNGYTKKVKISKDPTNKLILIDRLVAMYVEKANVLRVTSTDLNSLKNLYPNSIALIIFPRLSKDELIETVRNGALIPNGISRFSIPARALNINIPMKILMSDSSLDSKNLWLEKWHADKIKSNGIRLYMESTVVYDE